MFEFAPPIVVRRNIFKKAICEKNIILFIGRLHPDKNPLYLLSEWMTAKDFLNEFRLIIIGDGPLRSALARRIGDCRIGNVNILGELSRDQVEEYLNVSKYLIMPSIRESFGMAIVEAMARRVVPIVSDRGAMREIVSARAGHVFELKEGCLANILKLVALDDKDYEMKCEEAFNDSLKYGEEVIGERLLSILLE